MGIAPDKNGLLWISDLTGGLNDTDAPQDLATNQCQIAQNVEWVTTRFAQRRQGGVNSIHATEPWGTNTSLRALIRHTPTADEGAAELWGFNNNSPTLMGRMAAGNQFANVAVTDAWTEGTGGVTLQHINGVSLNGKLFVAGDNAVDRLHVWDSSAFRRVGLTTPAAATVANTGAGTYAATLRYYKVQWANLSLFPAQRSPKSELSDAVSFTPSGTGTHARVTRPSAPGEGETHWFILGSPDGVNYYVLAAPIAIATTTYDDNVAPSAYADALAVLAGYPTDADYYTAPISPKYLLADEDRLVLLSSWETASMASAVMWTPVLGTTPDIYNVADDERVPSTNRLDLDRSDGGGITGGGIVDGVIYVFKLSHIYRLARTGDAELPYKGIPITKAIGAISHKSIVVGEDDSGNACLYFLSRRGPYRIGPYGLEYLGGDIEATWDIVNLSAVIPPYGVWHPKKRQVWWWITTGVATVSTHVLVFHARHGHRTDNGEVRGGWATYTGGVADAYAAVMFANTLGATMSLDLKPYVAQSWTSGLPDGPVIKYDADGTYTDRGGLQSTYTGRVKTLAFPPGGPGMKGRVTQSYVLGTPANRTLTVDVVSNFGEATRSGTATLPSASASETREFIKVDDDARAADSMYIEVVLDDDVSPASSAAWTVDAIGLRVKTEGQI